MELRLILQVDSTKTRYCKNIKHDAEESETSRILELVHICTKETRI
jgi:hypothetical protein